MLITKLVSYAQNREDVFLHAILKGAKKGFYVDVGANHPVRDSVTKHFYNQGWRGINIEPSPKLHALLQADRPHDTNLMIGVSNKKGRLKFREYERGDGLSTFSTEMQKMYEKNKYFYASKYKEYDVPVVTLAGILKEQKVGAIDFLKVDIEGYEYEALAGNDWETYRPRVICIEANHIIKDWHGLLEKAGYRKVAFDGLNEYFVRREDKKLADTFSYADDILLAPPFISWGIHNEFLDADRQNRQLAFHLEQSELDLKSCRQEVASKPAGHPGGMRARVKSIIKKVDRKIESRLAVSLPIPDPLPAGITSAPDKKLAKAIGQSLGTTLEKQYHGSKQAVARYYGNTRNFIAAKRKRR